MATPPCLRTHENNRRSLGQDTLLLLGRARRACHHKALRAPACANKKSTPDATRLHARPSAPAGREGAAPRVLPGGCTRPSREPRLTPLVSVEVRPIVRSALQGETQRTGPLVDLAHTVVARDFRVLIEGRRGTRQGGGEENK